MYPCTPMYTYVSLHTPYGHVTHAHMYITIIVIIISIITIIIITMY